VVADAGAEDAGVDADPSVAEAEDTDGAGGGAEEALAAVAGGAGGGVGGAGGGTLGTAGLVEEVGADSRRRFFAATTPRDPHVNDAKSSTAIQAIPLRFVRKGRVGDPLTQRLDRPTPTAAGS